MKCENCQKDFVSENHFSKLEIIEGRRKRFCSKKCYGESKRGKIPYPGAVEKMRASNLGGIGPTSGMIMPRGELSKNWRGGRTTIHERARKSTEYKLWRKAVFERDNYTCIWCDDRQKAGHKVILHADHIKPFAYFPALRFAIDNGRTLCFDCHKKTETYGVKRLTKIGIEKGEHYELAI